MQDARWLFFDLGNTLISERRAGERRIQRLVSSLERYGRRRAIEEVRAALREASEEFASWQHDAKGIRLSRPVPRLSSRQQGISRLRPASPGHTELRARQPALSPILKQAPRPWPRAAKLYGAP